MATQTITLTQQSVHLLLQPLPTRNATPGQVMVAAIAESSVGLQAEAGRIESGLAACSRTEDTLPALIQKNGELRAALMIAQGELGNLEMADAAHVAALRGQITSLQGALAQTRIRVEQLRSEHAALQQQMQDLNLPSGGKAAWDRLSKAEQFRMRF